MECKLYFDLEGYENRADAPTIFELMDVTEKCVQHVILPLYGDPQFDPMEHVAVATRHRWSTPRSVWKHSVRVYVAYAIQRTSIPNYIKTWNIAKRVKGTCVEIDMGVYKEKEQLLGCVGFGKHDALDYTLKPDWRRANVPDTAFLAQYTADCIQTLSIPSDKEESSALKEAVPSKYDSDASGTELDELLDMLDPRMVDDRQDWIRIGMALKSGGEENFAAWQRWSMRSSKYDEGSCEKDWSGLNPNRVSMGTVHWMAKRNQPEAYAAWLERRKEKGFDRLLEGAMYEGDVSMANVVVAITKKTWVNAGTMSKPHFFRFEGHGWQDAADGTPLYRSVFEKIRRLIMERMVEARIKADAIGDDESRRDEKNAYEDASKRWAGVNQKLDTTKYKDSVWKQVKALLSDTKFVEKLDANVDLLGFDNGVLDLKARRFRDGRPEDFVSMSVGYSRATEVDPAVRQRLHELMFSFFEDEGTVLHTMRNLACSVSGNPLRQLVHIWQGSGGNGKSLLIDLVGKVFGAYAITLPITLYTKEVSSSTAATPDVARMPGARVFAAWEPNSDDKQTMLQMGFIKNISGQDKMTCRKLFGDPFEFRPQGVQYLGMNKMPALPVMDEDSLRSVTRRIRVTAFPFNFVEDPKPNTKDRKIDTSWCTEIEENVAIRQQMMLWLEETYFSDLADRQPIPIPPAVAAATQRLLLQSNPLVDFIEARYDRIDPTERGLLTVHDRKMLVTTRMKEMFHMWASQNDVNGKSVSKVSQFETAMKALGFHKSISMGYDHWKGLRPKQESFADDDPLD
jgi:phage/plasmid-associated DNA primase